MSLYYQIPLLSDSTFFSKLFFAFKFQYLQIPTSLLTANILLRLSFVLTCDHKNRTYVLCTFQLS